MKKIHLLSLFVFTAVFASCGTQPMASDGQTANAPLAAPHPEGKKNLVVSPYRPYNVIDVKGYKSGDIVGDPSTASVNPKTGKLDARTARHFRIP